MVIIFDQI